METIQTNPLISKHTVEFIFEAAHIQRWNEFIRPSIGFTELDKQAHKAIIAFILMGSEEGVDEERLIRGFIFEFLARTLLTDIKPPIYKRLLNTHSKEIYAWTIKELTEKVPELANFFGAELGEYYLSNTPSKEHDILRAAHYLASKWEFKTIAPQNSEVYGFEETKKALENELEEHYSLIGVQKMALGQKSGLLVDLLGRLRFQKRWTSTPRIPETSVMGHMLITALLSYFSVCMIDGACKARRINAFFGGLFHDLPEVLTRDIISPIKRSVSGLDDILKEIELRLIEEELLPIAPQSIKERLKYLVIDEFANKVTLDGKTTSLRDINELNERYNEDIYNPIDGSIINACDKLSAYFEAALSIKHGIKSEHLLGAVSSLKAKNSELNILSVDFGRMYAIY